MLAAAARAWRQLFSPPFRTVFWKSLSLTLAVLAVLVIAIVWGLGALVIWPGWIETTMQVLGGFALLFGSVFLIAPVTSLIAGLYLDDIAEEVEREHYPQDPPGKELPVATSIGLAIKFFFVVVGVNLLVLLLLLVPGVNLFAFFVGNGYLLGREYFELAASRHMPIVEAKALRRANGPRVFLAGLVIAGLVSIPILNLLTPLFATAFMVHVFKGTRRERDGVGATVRAQRPA